MADGEERCSVHWATRSSPSPWLASKLRMSENHWFLEFLPFRSLNDSESEGENYMENPDRGAETPLPFLSLPQNFRTRDFYLRSFY